MDRYLAARVVHIVPPQIVDFSRAQTMVWLKLH